MGGESPDRGLPRLVDICIAAAGLLLSSPILVVSAGLIKLTSRGPAVFRQVRVGRNGKTFTLFKLRTMNNDPGGRVTASGDSRVTPIGKILRLYKIDELPQLWNVVRGDMSMVGPRPEVPDLVDLADPNWVEVLAFRPGITDPVTLKLRNEEQLLAEVQADISFYRAVIQPYKLKGYLDFLRGRTWKTDLEVIWRTAAAVVLPGSVIPPSIEEIRLSLAK